MDNEQAEIQRQIREYIQSFCLMTDEFMVKVLGHPECTELFLRIVMEREDLKVTEVRPHPEFKNLYGHSSILDIVAHDRDGVLYNIEIQRNDEGAAPERARYHSSILDTNTLKSGTHYTDLPETYVIFVTEHDVLADGLPRYHVERTIAENGKPFKDRSHILYVNSQIQDNTPLGQLMHDFYCKKSSDMHYPELAEQVRYYKETEEGQNMMSIEAQQLIRKSEERGEKRGEILGEKKKANAMVLAMLKGNEPYEKIAKYTDLSIEEIKKIDAERK